MSNTVTFGGLTAAMPEGWFDVTEDLPDGSPTTLAKPEGIGALQFTVAKYQSGALPAIGVADLQKLLNQFAESKGLGSPLREHQGQGVHPYLAADFRAQDELIRVWYLSNSKDIALITYVTQQPDAAMAEEELRDATLIVESVNFA